MIKWIPYLLVFLASLLTAPALKAERDSSLYLNAQWENANNYTATEQKLTYLQKQKYLFFRPSIKSIQFVSHQREFLGNDKNFNDYGLRGNLYLIKDLKNEVYFGASAFLENYFSEKLGGHIGYDYKFHNRLTFQSLLEWKTYEDTRRNIVLFRPGLTYYWKTFDFSYRVYNVFNDLEGYLFAHMFGIAKTYKNFRISYAIAQGEEINDLAIIDEFWAHSLSLRYRKFTLTGTIHRGNKRDAELIGLYFTHVF